MGHTCCVHGCSHKAGSSAEVRFYRIPAIRLTEGEQTKDLSRQRHNTWLARINRKNFVPTAHTRICSAHFVTGKPAELYDSAHPDWAPSLKLAAEAPVKIPPNKLVPSASSSLQRYQRSAKRRQKRKRHTAAEQQRTVTESDDDVPVPPVDCSQTKKQRKKQFCFQERQDSSNTLPCSAPLPLTDLLPDDPEHRPMDVSRSDHDYCSSGLPPSQSAAVDAVLMEKQRLQAESAALRRQIEEIALRSKFGLERFAASDEDIRFYTRFESYAHLMSFWSQIEPATGDIVHVTRARSTALTDHDAVPSRLWPIDEFFLFMTCLSLGLVPEDLAHRFNLHQSSVITIIASWANFLYAVLGAIGIWLDEDTVKRNMPEVFSHYADTHLILDVVELRCQTADSLLLHSEAFSALRPHTSFKGLTGTAPHGPVTFVSPLCDGGISDRNLLKQSGLIPLLQPHMAVMADKRFQVEDLVPCKVHVSAFRKTPPGARLRAHIEHIKGRVKEHELFSTVIPFSLTGCISQLFVVACLLVNYQSGRLESDS